MVVGLDDLAEVEGAVDERSESPRPQPGVDEVLGPAATLRALVSSRLL